MTEYTKTEYTKTEYPKTEYPKNNWYDRVYLCYEDRNYHSNNYSPINGFICYKYNSFENADNAWYKRTELHKLELRHTMIPVCKWLPSIFDKYVLKWNLKHMYWKDNVSIGYEYKGSPKKLN